MRNLDIADTRSKLEMYARQGRLLDGQINLMGTLAPAGAEAIAATPEEIHPDEQILE
jgi:argininosuccinate synthase